MSEPGCEMPPFTEAAFLVTDKLAACASAGKSPMRGSRAYLGKGRFELFHSISKAKTAQCDLKSEQQSSKSKQLGVH